MVAAAVVGAAAIGAVGSTVAAGASKSAANTQAQAAEDAAHLQNDQWNQTQANLAPYMKLGASNINALQSALSNPLFNQQFSAPTQAQAAATPGYQFTLQQGLKSVQNSAAARGLGNSGAALKGASSYATGLADSTYNDVFNRALSTFNTNYSNASSNVNRLSGIVGNGQNAAATNGSLGAQAVGNIGNTITSGANASAAGTVGAANALSNGLNGVGSSGLTYGLLTNNAASASNPSVPVASGTTSGNNRYGFTI